MTNHKPHNESLLKGQTHSADRVSLSDWLAGAAALPTITLWQPWATWIMRGWKKIETRIHPRFECLNGKRIGIHAGLRVDDSPIVTHNPYLTREQIIFQPEDVVCGFLLGSALVTGFRRLNDRDSNDALIDCGWKQARWGLFLSDIRLAPKPIKIRGAQGIWTFRNGGTG